MAAPQQPRSAKVMTDLDLKSDLNMHRALSGSFRVRIEARREWVKPGDFRNLIFERINAYAITRTFGNGVDRALWERYAARQQKTLARSDAAGSPQDGYASCVIARSPRLASPDVQPPADRPGANMI